MGHTRHLDLTREDHAYFFGLFQTDGHLSAGPGRKGRAAIELSEKDDATLRAFCDLFPTVHTSMAYRTRATNFSATHRVVVWRAFAEGFRAELAALGVPVGSKSTSVAPPTTEFDERGYLRGLVDGDGSVGFTRTGAPFVSFTTASAALAEFFCATVLAITGATRNAKRNARDGVFGPMVVNDPAATLAAWLYPTGCLALDRKRLAAERVATWTRPPTMRARAARRPWTPEEDAIVLALPIRDAALRLGRSDQSVNVRRWRLRSASRTAGVECRKDAGVVDEIPAAYKDIDEVIRDQSDLVEVVARLKQVVCVKG